MSHDVQCHLIGIVTSASSMVSSFARKVTTNNGHNATLPQQRMRGVLKFRRRVL